MSIVLLVTTLLMSWVYFFAQETFSPAKELQVLLRKESQKVAKMELQQDILENQLLSLRQQALEKLMLSDSSSALGIEEQSWKLALRGPASEGGAVAKAEVLFAQGQQAFENKKWAEARKIFDTFIANYSFHPKLLQARLLLGEVEMQDQKKEAAVSHFVALFEQFPESKEAGFAGIRLISLLQAQNMQTEAEETARILEEQFKNDPEIIKGLRQVRQPAGVGQ